jgi:hypothetical protein
METTTSSTFRAVIVHEGGKYGYTYNMDRATADEAFADRDRLANDPVKWGGLNDHKVEFVVTETTSTVTKDGLSRAEVILTSVVER